MKMVSSIFVVDVANKSVLFDTTEQRLLLWPPDYIADALWLGS